MKQSTAHLIQTSRQSRPPASLKLPAGPKMRTAADLGRDLSFPALSSTPRISVAGSHPQAGQHGEGLEGVRGRSHVGRGTSWYCSTYKGKDVPSKCGFLTSRLSWLFTQITFH